MAKAQPLSIVLAGPQLSGKSTWARLMRLNYELSVRADNEESDLPLLRHLSQDSYIHQCAARDGKKYRDVFHDCAHQAETCFKKALSEAIESGDHVILDRMHPSRKSRAEISHIFRTVSPPNGQRYVPIAVNFMPGAEELRRRHQEQFGNGIHKIGSNILEQTIERFYPEPGQKREGLRYSWASKPEGFYQVFDNPHEASLKLLAYLISCTNGSQYEDTLDSMEFVLPGNLPTKVLRDYTEAHLNVETNDKGWLENIMAHE